MRKSFVSVTRSKFVGKFLSVLVFLSLALSSSGSSPVQLAQMQTENPPPDGLKTPDESVSIEVVLEGGLVQQDDASRIRGVPDYEQWMHLPRTNGFTGCMIGCMPTASGNIVGYWADHGYPSLMDGGGGGETTSCNESCRATIRALRHLMRGHCDEGDYTGWVEDQYVVPGLSAYFQNHGANFQIAGYWAYGFGFLVRDYYALYKEQIDNEWPVLLTYKTNTGAHAVTGVGYREGLGGSDQILVHENIDCTHDEYGNVVPPCNPVDKPMTFPPGLWSWIITIRPPEAPSPPPPPSPPSTDSATFLSHITLPDGSAVPPGLALVKTWRVQNSGDTTWGGYKLKFVGGDQMGAPETGIPTTEPQDTVDISINLTAPTQPGDYQAYFQIVNAGGVWVEGGRLWVSIHVLPPPISNITLSADPPSPASADHVRIYARVEDFPNFRAMRVLVDGEPICELDAPEITDDCTWHTDGYAVGQHTIVVEVDDWSGPAWDNPHRKSLVYELTGIGPINHAPDRPILESPYDWYVSIGSPPQLCAQGSDPEGDTLQYQFEAVASVGTYNSGWVSSNCHTFGSVNAGTYGWRARTRDRPSSNGESNWSDTRHFTVETSGVTIDELYFELPDPDVGQEQVRIRACTSGHGGVNVSLSARVNDATDGTDSGQWHIIKGLDVPCFNEEDAPIWHTLEYGDGTHLVRVVATAIEPPASDMRDATYTLGHRRPASTRLVAPVPPSENRREAIYLNSRTISFRWEPTIRADSYTLHIGTNPPPVDDPSPVFRQTLDPRVTGYTVTFSQDYPALYWQVSATNDVGTNASGDQLFGIDRLAPSCTVQPLLATTYERVFQVNWGGSDDLAGIRTFDIQYLDSGRGEWSDWLTDAPATKPYELFTGQPGHTYSFRCRATDNAGNTGLYPSGADTSIRVDPTVRPPTPWWDTAYSEKRNLTILNNMPGMPLPAGYPVHLHFDSSTRPVAAELYNASQSSQKCDDLRIVYNNATELNRVVQNCSSSAIDIWFRIQADIAGGSSESTAYQLYYGNANAGAPPADPHQVWYPYREGDTAELYFFQEGSGSTAYDSSGNGRHCSLDTSVQWAPSKFGNGLRFDRANGGDSRSLICNGAAALSSFTVELWYKPDPDDSGRIAGQVGLSGGQTNWVLENQGGRIGLGVWPCPSCGSSGVQSDFNLRDSPYVGNWNHIAVTFNGGDEVRFYVNGSLDSTKHLPQSGISTHNAPLEIGSAGGSGR